MIKRLKENKRKNETICPLIKMDVSDSMGLKLEMEIAQEFAVEEIQTFIVASVCGVLGLTECQHMDGELNNGTGTLNYICAAEEGDRTMETYYMNIWSKEIERFRSNHTRVVQYNVHLVTDDDYCERVI